jgi:hypothetical protein
MASQAIPLCHHCVEQHDIVYAAFALFRFWPERGNWSWGFVCRAHAPSDDPSFTTSEGPAAGG